MKTLIFRNTDSTLRVEYHTDLLDGSDSNFTVMQVIGLSAAEETFGLQFHQLPYNLGAFKQFAIDNNLILEAISTDVKTTLVGGSIIDLAISTASPLPDGADSVPYSEALVGVGGNGTKVWSIFSGTLPTGLSLDASTGVISGTPTVVETQVFVVKLSDTFTSVTKSLSLTITA